MIVFIHIVLKRRFHVLLDQFYLFLPKRILIIILRFITLRLLYGLFRGKLVDQIFFSNVLVRSTLVEGRDFLAIINNPRVPIKVLLSSFFTFVLIDEHEFLALTLIGMYRF